MITGALPTQYLFNRAWSVQLTPVVPSGKDQFGNVLYQPSSTGQLFAQDQNGTQFGQVVPGKNYHGLDYALFAMNIRENAIARVTAYLGRTALK